jgi:hypothetical protein
MYANEAAYWSAARSKVFGRDPSPAKEHWTRVAARIRAVDPTLSEAEARAVMKAILHFDDTAAITATDGAISSGRKGHDLWQHLATAVGEKHAGAKALFEKLARHATPEAERPVPTVQEVTQMLRDQSAKPDDPWTKINAYRTAEAMTEEERKAAIPAGDKLPLDLASALVPAGPLPEHPHMSMTDNALAAIVAQRMGFRSVPELQRQHGAVGVMKFVRELRSEATRSTAAMQGETNLQQHEGLHGQLDVNSPEFQKLDPWQRIALTRAAKARDEQAEQD